MGILLFLVIYVCVIGIFVFIVYDCRARREEQWMTFCRKINELSGNQLHIVEQASTNVIQRGKLLTEDNVIAEINRLILN